MQLAQSRAKKSRVSHPGSLSIPGSVNIVLWAKLKIVNYLRATIHNTRSIYKISH